MEDSKARKFVVIVFGLAFILVLFLSYSFFSGPGKTLEEELISATPYEQEEFKIEYVQESAKFRVTILQEPISDNVDLAIEWFAEEGVENTCDLKIFWTASQELIKAKKLKATDFPRCQGDSSSSLTPSISNVT
ncbi:MAG: hypothetical protein A2Y57_00315 [Candidatus Woykebacteria bacterium RBG_13_40_7b]|uniref:Uncharacterized protein n=1 Tax=Candidatus Woykebacteria bacterium RBG_13_40_7b TaxID=1802594 RepID=A0A1G1WAI2_9BACT|nr:MAG: hypothetical protein A2Y57_00315 [Candidatus Woykebacteria bacterium RBG_13_40_7b]